MIQRRAAALAALLLAVGVLSASAQGSSCPDLFLGPVAAKDAVVQSCVGATSCDACQCSLVKAVTPRLLQSGQILASEAWMPSSLNTIADVLTKCKKDFELQLLQNTNASISQLANLDTCATDVKVVSQCISGAASSSNTTANATVTATATPSSAPDSDGMASEVMAEACGASVSGSSSAGSCPSPAAARMIAGVPLTMGSSMVYAPVSDADVLSISSSNTRGPTTWRAFCWCDDNWDPVCDAATRKQYPNACSAKCQNVSKVVPCSSLEPLVNQTMAGNTPVFVVDQSLMRAAAFNGPMPAEAPEDAQSFYYYYEDDADDTQDALDIASTLAEALLAAKYGDEVVAVDAMGKTLPVAVQAGAAANGMNVTKADGPAGNATAPGMTPTGPLAALRNITITRQRLGANRAAQAPRERRNVTVSLPSPASGTAPPSPTWMMTSSPDDSAGVYKRDAERTSRILASLMAAAQQAANNTKAAGVVGNIAPGLENLVRAAAGAVQANQNAAGNILRSSNIAPALAEARSALGNLSALNRTMTNMTATPRNAFLEGLTETLNMTGAGANTTMMQPANMTLPMAGINSVAAANPSLRAFSGLANGRQGGFGSRLSAIVQELRTLVDRPAAVAARPNGLSAVAALQGLQGQRPAGGLLRSGLGVNEAGLMMVNGTMRMGNSSMGLMGNATMDMSNSTMVANTTGNSTGNSTAMPRSATNSKQQKPKRHLLFF